MVYYQPWCLRDSKSFYSPCSLMLSFVSVLSNRLIVVAAVYQTKRVLALSVAVLTLKQTILVAFHMQK